MARTFPPTRAELEASLEAYFRKVVRQQLNGYTMKLVPAEKGAPDRLVLLPGGRVILLELKAVGGALAPAQRYWHDRASDLGTHVPVLVGREQVDQWALDMSKVIHGS